MTDRTSQSTKIDPRQFAQTENREPDHWLVMNKDPDFAYTWARNDDSIEARQERMKLRFMGYEEALGDEVAAWGEDTTDGKPTMLNDGDRILLKCPIERVRQRKAKQMRRFLPPVEEARAQAAKIDAEAREGEPKASGVGKLVESITTEEKIVQRRG